MGSANILLIEDEANVAFVTGTALRLADYTVADASSGQEGLTIASQQPIDLAVLDVMLSDLDGFAICQKLRSSGHDFPIMFLTARDSTDDRVRGLTIGGDDYLTKPFSVEELVARVHAILRRVGKEATGKIYRCGPLSLNDAAHLVLLDAEQVDLSPTEYKLLRFLLRNTGRVLSRDQILDHVWDYDFAGETNVVDTYIHTLRKKIGSDGPRLIQTVRGVGYRMIAPPTA